MTHPAGDQAPGAAGNQAAPGRAGASSPGAETSTADGQPAGIRPGGLPGRPALAVEKLSKTFGVVRALSSLDMSVASGEIHALLGENGSGKSTLIKILSGYHRPDPGGAVHLDGQPLVFGSSASAHALGCRFVHQDLGLVYSSSILDNLFLTTSFPTRVGTVRGREALRLAREDLAKVGLNLDPRLAVGGLTPAHKTGIAVARALHEEADVRVRLLVLDEPTATLPEAEVEQLLEIVRRVADSGVAVIYVTHRLDEVFHLADNVTVLRDGREVATEPISALDRRRLVNLLVGSEFEEIHAASEALHSEHGDPILEVQNLAAGPLTGISFQIRPGDIVGVAGITGSGRDVVLGALFGATPREGGTVRVTGRALPPMRPDLAMGMGMAYIPPDRKTQGGMMDLTARENLAITSLRQFWRRLHLRRKPELAEARSWFERLSVRPAGAVNQLLSRFSGGNQQKILFGKWLRRMPAVFLLDEPTQGVDVGAKAELHGHLLAAAQGGAAVVVSSSDVDELAALCHRVIVLRNGQIVSHLSGQKKSVANISRECLGAGGKVVVE